ncbi:MAG: DUF11 domain-containing protein [Bacteroidia bacterium]|nr:DUF11 domain-containing protein [Bacteroidia bacterium]
MKRIHLFTFLLLMFFSAGQMAVAQNDLPVPTANIQAVKNGSLVIPMDTLNQRRPGYFNLKAYGLVNTLLQNEIPVKWVIKSGKTRTSAGSIDFTANLTRVFPDTASLGTLPLRSGAFVIDSAWLPQALPLIAAYANDVIVYRFNANVNLDVRYTLTHKPRILLLNSMGFDTIAVKYLQEAGFDPGSYKLQLPAGSGLDPNGNWSLISETHLHTSDTALLNPLLRYSVQRGANLLLSCTSLGSMENSTYTMTTAGIDSFSTGLAAVNYLNADLPIAQFLGPIMSPNGEYKIWKPKAGSSLRSNAYEIMRGTTGGLLYTMAGMKMRPNTLAGGNLFYISGHEHYQWAAPSGSINDNNRINGRRIFLNSVFIPASDSIDQIDFKTDVLVSIFAQAGLAVKYEDFKIYIVASNSGPGRARSLTVDALLPAGLTYKSHSSTYGNFNPLSGVWALDSLTKNQSDTLVLNVAINQLGTMKYITTISNSSYEPNKLNNTDTLVLFGVSRPVALNDTIPFTAPLFVDYPVKTNDSDEDGGPFGNTSILAGPFHGTAAVFNNDSIRYTLTASGYTGTDSLQYLSCDNYPLCDTAWFFIQIASPLPVSLVNFSGSRREHLVRLEWYTLSEKDNDHFDIERSSNGQQFEKRGSVAGAGNSNTPLRYTFDDPGNDAPVLYYRLQQTDFDGTRSVSNVIALPIYGRNGFSASIYPNPGDGTLQVIRAEGVSGTLTLTISDLGGRTISEKSWECDPNGLVLEVLENHEKPAPGCYVATFRTAMNSKSLKLIIR